MRIALKQVLTPRSFEHWNRKIGLRNRIKIQAWQWGAKYPVRVADALIPGQNLRLGRATTWVDKRIGTLQEDRYQDYQKFNY